MKDLGLSALMATCLMWLLRALVKYMYDNARKNKKSKRVFIYGVKEGGVAIADSMLHRDSQHTYVIKGFVADDGDMDIQGRRLMGSPIFPTMKTL